MESKVCIITFGCQMNKLDSQLLRGELVRHGYGLTEEPEQADVLLYNTCSVRAHAEDKVWSHLGRWKKRASRDPDFVVGVMGCMAQRLSVEIVKRFGFVKLVCGTRRFLNVPAHLGVIRSGGGPVVDVEETESLGFERDAAMREGGHSAFVSIMRGCDNFCTYCIVPYVRGREMSRRPGDVEDEVRRLVEEGVAEVTLLGQNVNSYGRRFAAGGATPDGSVRLADLLERLSSIEGLLRLRFVTSHPKDMDDDIMRAVAGLDKVCESLHVPAQSGSDRILGRMNRGYTAAGYRAMIERARELIPGVALSGDFIVGFPGETDDEFGETLRLLRDVRYQQSFVFKYSPRPGSTSADWADDVPDEVKRERNQLMLKAQEEIDLSRRRSLVGSKVEVLVDGVSKQDDRHRSGRTRQNDIAVFQGDDTMTGQLVCLRIVDATALTLFGEPQVD